MNQTLTFNDYKSAGLILGTIVLYYLYYYFSQSNFLKSYIRYNPQKEPKIWLLFFIRKISGFFVLGVIPGLLCYFIYNFSFEKFGLTFGHFKTNFLIIFILVSVIFLVTFVYQKTGSQNSSLQLKLKSWNLSFFAFNSLGWIIYLTGYEFLFRGILLFGCYYSFGFWPAIAVNVAIYSAIHMVDGKNEAIGALFYGIVACYFTLLQETIWIPIFMHIALSLSSDFFSIKLNRKIIFEWPKFINLSH